MARFRFLCIAGTGSRFHAWCHDEDSIFMTEMRKRGGEPIRLPGGKFLYTWSGALGGTFWTGDQIWYDEAEQVREILTPYEYEDRIVFAHSHGGQIPIILAASGFHIRSLTTIATPHRPNLEPAIAARCIGYWQHLYDPERDWIATLPSRIAGRLGLGGLGGGASFGSRAFNYPGVTNIPIKGIRHSRIFEDQFYRMNVVLDSAVTRGMEE